MKKTKTEEKKCSNQNGRKGGESQRSPVFAAVRIFTVLPVAQAVPNLRGLSVPGLSRAATVSD